MKKTLCVLIIFQALFGYSQNLVPNPGFELYKDCPNKLKQLNLVNEWFSPGTGTPEYFNCEFYLNAKPYAGKGLVAFIPYGVYNVDLEYLAVELIDSLKKGLNYCIEFYVNPDSETPVLINNIGIFFSKEKLRIAHWNFNEYEPQVSTKEIFPAGQWSKFSKLYKAEGGERFLNIGNFFGKENTELVSNARPKSEAWFAYYYLDEFSVYESELGCDAVAQPSLSQAYKQKHIVYFESNQSNISKDELSALGDFIFQLPYNSKIQIQLVGHTDSDASDSYNIELSRSRVYNVEQYLKRLSKFNLVKDWKGESLPLNKNSNPQEKSLNRRVEIYVIP